MIAISALGDGAVVEQHATGDIFQLFLQMDVVKSQIFELTSAIYTPSVFSRSVLSDTVVSNRPYLARKYRVGWIYGLTNIA